MQQCLLAPRDRMRTIRTGTGFALTHVLRSAQMSQDVLPLRRGQLLGGFTGQLQSAIGSPALEVVPQLPEERTAQVHRQMNAVMLLYDVRHRVVVAQCMESNPGMKIAAFGSLEGRVLVDGLVLVPEEGEVKLRADEKRSRRSDDLRFTDAASQVIGHAIAVGERSQPGFPVAVRPVVETPAGCDFFVRAAPVASDDLVSHANRLARLHGPGGDAHPDRLPRTPPPRIPG